MTDADAQLQLKKRARRRLVGAVAFAAFAAIVLPVVMDQKPAPVVQDVEIRIPGQDEQPFTPAVVPPEVPVAAAVRPESSASATAQPAPPVVPPPAVVANSKVADKPVEKPVKPAEKKVDKPAEKADKPPAEAKENPADARRAADILTGKSAATPPANGQFVILIGAFADPANVVNLKKKLGELGITVYTEALDQKTRVRAGPFHDRSAAEKALQKMQKIGVNGQIAAKQ
jgi:DedD protein